MNKPNTPVCLCCPHIEKSPEKQCGRVQLPAIPSLSDRPYSSDSEEKALLPKQPRVECFGANAESYCVYIVYPPILHNIYYIYGQ